MSHHNLTQQQQLDFINRCEWCAKAALAIANGEGVWRADAPTDEDLEYATALYKSKKQGAALGTNTRTQRLRAQ